MFTTRRCFGIVLLGLLAWPAFALIGADKVEDSGIAEKIEARQEQLKEL